MRNPFTFLERRTSPTSELRLPSPSLAAPPAQLGDRALEPLPSASGAANVLRFSITRSQLSTAVLFWCGPPPPRSLLSDTEFSSFHLKQWMVLNVSSSAPAAPFPRSSRILETHAFFPPRLPHRGQSTINPRIAAGESGFPSSYGHRLRGLPFIFSPRFFSFLPLAQLIINQYFFEVYRTRTGVVSVGLGHPCSFSPTAPLFPLSLGRSQTFSNCGLGSFSWFFFL